MEKKRRVRSCRAGTATRSAVAFEKATQNNRRVCANKVRDKSKFVTNNLLTISVINGKMYLYNAKFGLLYY